MSGAQAVKGEQAVERPVLDIPKVEQAAILLMSLGEAEAAEILKHMGPKEVQRLGTAMSRLANVQQDTVAIDRKSVV